MKRLIIFLIISLCLSLTGCTFPLFDDLLLDVPDRITESWQTVTIGGLGTFRVPTEWNVEQQEGILYITDKPISEEGYAIYLVGTVSGIGTPSHEFFEGVEEGETLLSPIFTNGVSLLLIEYIVNGIKEEHHLIILRNDKSTSETNRFELFVWDCDVVDEYIAEQIAMTFSDNLEDFDNPNIGQLMP